MLTSLNVLRRAPGTQAIVSDGSTRSGLHWFAYSYELNRRDSRKTGYVMFLSLYFAFREANLVVVLAESDEGIFGIVFLCSTRF